MTNTLAEPVIYAIAGSPASGKTTFLEAKKRDGLLPQDAYVYNCDDVMLSSEGYQADLQMLGPAKAFQNWERFAREQADSLLMEAVAARRQILYDRSCGMPESYRLLESLVQQGGYSLIMHVLYVSEKKALMRAKERERAIRRHIPPQVVSERLKGIVALWPSYLQLAKLCYLYDSNNRSYDLIASSQGGRLAVLDQMRYQAFLEKR